MWTIEITQEDIDRGRIADMRSCAIAVVLKDGQAYEISVAGLIVIGKDRYKATRELRRWISAFDSGKAVMPITIELAPYQFAKRISVRYVRAEDRRQLVSVGPASGLVDICGEARVAGVDSADGSRNSI
ncbi:MAG: hypothetical protein OXP71_00110 [Candidatus Poribacteria bacterium]|nr:hypothetical protein [Candidatus Poribacteria bacterium]